MTNDKDSAVLLHCPNCEATEQKLHDFRQKVSDIVHDYVHGAGKKGAIDVWESLKGLIIPAPKPDPLVEVLGDLEWNNNSPECASNFRAALDARGLEIRSKNDD